MPILREHNFKFDKYFSVQDKKEEWLNPAILRDTAILLTHYFERTERDSNPRYAINVYTSSSHKIE